MMTIKNLLLFLLLIIGVATQAQTHQHGVCGTTDPAELEMIRERLSHNLEVLRHDGTHPRTGVIKWVPVKMQLVATIYENGNGIALGTSLKEPNAINIYFCKTATSGNTGGVGLTLAYYSPNGDYIVSRTDAAGDTPTLSHEVGHFFSLMHTFYGWEEGSFDSSFPTWPCAPTHTSIGVLVEKADGSNCQQAADQICDTPANYILFGNCNYTGGAKDPTCVLINPDETNYMGYFDDVCQTNFTPNQMDAMLIDYNSQQRAYIRVNYTPNTSEIASAVTLTAPTNNETLSVNYVNLQWNPVAGATNYLLEYDRTSTFSLAPTRIVVNGANTYYLNNLLANKNYYWRVFPFNESNGCGASLPISTFKFTTGEVVSVDEIEEINQYWYK